MTPEDFVQAVRDQTVESGLKTYRDLFDTTAITEASDEYWRNALKFYYSLDDQQRNIFFGVLRQVMVDTVSDLFSILDGVSWLDKQKDDFRLLHQDEKLNGDLQDLLLEMENPDVGPLR